MTDSLIHGDIILNATESNNNVRQRLSFDLLISGAHLGFWAELGSAGGSSSSCHLRATPGYCGAQWLTTTGGPAPGGAEAILMCAWNRIR